jgi:predicted O-methyltransferase YrrM
VRARPGLRILAVEPRYWPRLAILARIPGLREVALWNCVIRVARRDDRVEGWLTEAQAASLAAAARGARRIVEIGSYRGRSTIVLARAAPPGAEVIAIDPHAGNDRGPQQWVGTADEGEADHMAFVANLARAGVAERVRHVRRRSQDALDAVPPPIDLLYIDGAHAYGPASQDIAGWGARVAPGGTLLIHDAFSSVGVTLAIGRLLLTSRELRYVGRTGSLAEYRREPVQRAVNAARQLAQLPWFVRNLLVKAAIVARLPALARLLGHREGPWPF